MTKTYRRFSDIERLIPSGVYSITLSWKHLEWQLDEWARLPGGLDLAPDFQRGHVWSEAQQIAFVEFGLRGGLEYSSDTLLFNCADWPRECRKPIQIVDGLQRLTAVRRFLRNEIPAFGTLMHDYEEELHAMSPRFRVNVNNLPTKADVLRWYLDLNTGGTAHTDEEIARVTALLNEELEQDNALPTPR